LDVTTTSTSAATFSARCPVAMLPPREARRRVMSLSLRSDPLTRYPRFSSSSAMPLMPIPPIPTKWTLTFLLRNTGGSLSSLRRMYSIRSTIINSGASVDSTSRDRRQVPPFPHQSIAAERNADVGDLPRGLRAAEDATRPRHPGEPRPVRFQRPQLVHELLRGQLL